MSQSNWVAPSTSASSDETTDYDRRLPHAKPTDTLRGLYFNGVFNAVKSAGGEQALRQFQELLKDPALKRRYIDFSNYPAMDFLKIASIATRVIAPHVGGQANAQRHIGKQGVVDFTSSMFGKTLMLLSGNSPAKSLASLPSSYSTSTNWGERTVTLLSETSARVTFRADLMPPCQHEGMLLAIVKSVNAKNPQVHTYPKGILDCDFEVTWEK
jgi:uncharacterized protein (TIGR02265 family)